MLDEKAVSSNYDKVFQKVMRSKEKGSIENIYAMWWNSLGPDDDIIIETIKNYATEDGIKYWGRNDFFNIISILDRLGQEGIAISIIDNYTKLNFLSPDVFDLSTESFPNNIPDNQYLKDTFNEKYLKTSAAPSIEDVLSDIIVNEHLRKEYIGILETIKADDIYKFLKTTKSNRLARGVKHLTISTIDNIKIIEKLEEVFVKLGLDSKRNKILLEPCLMTIQKKK